MSETPFHGYNVPEKGEENWHVPLNENFEQFDTDIEMRGPQSELGEWEDKLFELGDNQRKGAKYFATDTGKIYIARENGFGVVRSTGSSPELESIRINGPPRVALRSDLEFLGVGRRRPLTGSETFGIRTDKSGYGGMYIESTDTSGDGRPFYGYGVDGDNKAWHYFDPEAGNDDRPAWSVQHKGVGNPTIRVYRDSLVSNEDCFVLGNFRAYGNKSFVQPVDTDDGEKEVVYTSVESDTPHTETSGVVRLEDDRAEVDLPDHFSWVTSDDEPVMVQVTAHAEEPVRPQVTQRSPDRIVIVDFEDGAGDYEVSYTVRGVRDGHEDEQVVYEPDESPMADRRAKAEGDEVG